jgi:single-stranded-DNA-specific exonuclease
VPSFDLHGALGACATHLERFGGHRAAAGLSIDPERVDAFAAAFGAHADGLLTDDELRPLTYVDAIVPASTLGLDLCAELSRLAPFGLGNPSVTLMLAGCEMRDLATVGSGKHLAFRVRDRRRDAGRAIAFGMGPQLDRFRRVGAYDVAFRLEENHWNGTVAPQLVVRRIFDAPEHYEGLRARFAEAWKRGADAWTPEERAVFEELGLVDGVTWRSLLESPTFLRVLAGEAPELAAAA